MYYIDLLGLIASISSVVGFLPQIFKIYKRKSVQDISALMLLNFLICSLAWAFYGALTHSNYVLVTNVISSLVSCFLFGQKIYYKQ